MYTSKPIVWRFLRSNTLSRSSPRPANKLCREGRLFSCFLLYVINYMTISARGKLYRVQFQICGEITMWWRLFVSESDTGLILERVYISEKCRCKRKKNKCDTMYLSQGKLKLSLQSGNVYVHFVQNVGNTETRYSWNGDVFGRCSCEKLVLVLFLMVGWVPPYSTSISNFDWNGHSSIVHILKDKSLHRLDRARSVRGIFCRSCETMISPECDCQEESRDLRDSPAGMHTRIFIAVFSTDKILLMSSAQACIR